HNSAWRVAQHLLRAAQSSKENSTNSTHIACIAAHPGEQRSCLKANRHNINTHGAQRSFIWRTAQESENSATHEL
ncbi:hypothetical protein A2U01_0067838, partial [Trifolium medium]|nr:hypothetical protein [Trifolium medium]